MKHQQWKEENAPKNRSFFQKVIQIRKENNEKQVKGK